MKNQDESEEAVSLIANLEIENTPKNNVKDAVKSITDKSENIERLPSLFGIRGFLIILVFMTHCNWKVVRNSWMIIGAFFSFSGLLVTSMTLKMYEKHGSISILGFYQRRIARLIPLVMLILTVICIYIACMRYLRPDYFTPIDLYWHRKDMLAAT